MSTYKQYTIKNTVYFISIYPNILRLLGEEPILEEWADMHIISKNYELVEEQEDVKGGDD